MAILFDLELFYLLKVITHWTIQVAGFYIIGSPVGLVRVPVYKTEVVRFQEL
jgi:hypothetical protein